MLLIRSLLVAVISSFGCFGWNLGDFVVPHFGSKPSPRCQRYRQQCKFDRHCCAGLECRLEEQDYNIGYFCLTRLVDKTYVELPGGPSWKDYQEPISDLKENEGPTSLNAEDLYRRNQELQRKLAELRLLRRKVRQEQLKGLKRRLEEAEIEVLRAEKRKYEEKVNREIKKLKEKELEDKLLEMEKIEVNRTLSKPNRHGDGDVYMDMLG